MKALNLTSLDDLDPAVGEAFRVHLKRTADDCYDRPGDSKDRVVTLQVVITPVLDQAARACTECKARVQVSSSVPKHRSRVHSMRLQPSGQLLFNPDSPGDVNQETFLRDEED